MMARGWEVNQIGMEGRRRGSKISGLAVGEANCWHPGWWRRGGWKEWEEEEEEEEEIRETDRTEGEEWYFFFLCHGQGKISVQECMCSCM